MPQVNESEQRAFESTSGIEVQELGLVSYERCWALQQQLQRSLIAKEGKETLILCEHPQTITYGKRTPPSSFRSPREELEHRGINVFEVERGGDVTYHGPGQLVAYPILDLRERKRDIGWYMRTLESIVIETLSHYAIQGYRIEGKTGVWMNPDELPLRKIASIGVRLSRWCTMHGLAINVEDCSAGFSAINPCGFSDISVTSIAQEKPPLSPPPTVPEVGRRCGEILLQYFSA